MIGPSDLAPFMRRQPPARLFAMIWITVSRDIKGDLSLTDAALDTVAGACADKAFVETTPNTPVSMPKQIVRTMFIEIPEVEMQ